MNVNFEDLGFVTIGSKAVLIPILIDDDLREFMFTKRLYELGVFAMPVVSPLGRELEIIFSQD